MTVRVEAGDCREVIKTLADNSLHSCVTDPPYSLVSIKNRFGKTSVSDATKTSERSRKRTDPYARGATGFMGMQWDTGEVAHDPAFWAEIYRVLRPGGYLLAFAGTRTYHRMACAIEDAGFEIRDQIGWAYASGFPKSHDVSKAIDKAAGAERTELIGVKPGHEGFANRGNLSSVRSLSEGTMGQPGGFSRPWMRDLEAVEKSHHQFEPATEDARKWQGYGTALKPAWEPICVARKPLDGTVAQNVLKWGTGALNIDGCRIEGEKPQVTQGINTNPSSYNVAKEQRISGDPHEGRWPANLCHDDSDEVRACFPESAGQQADVRGTEPSKPGDYGVYASMDRTPFKARGRRGKGFTLPGGENGDPKPNGPTYAGEEDTSAARFFFASKADASDRWHSKHPTVKPVELMRWLVRLVTPPGGTVLDPFAGSGTTGVAAQVEARDCILIEREESYLADIRERLAASRGMATKPTPTRRRAKITGGLLEGIDE